MPNPIPSPLHHINVGPKGTFKPSGNHHTTPEQVDELIDHLRQQNTNRLVLYFHGGLVPEEAGMATAGTIQTVFSPTSCHPISLVWETGLLETIRTRISSVSDTRFFRKLLEYALKVAGDKIGLDDAGGKGAMSLTETDILTELQKDEPFADFDRVGGAKGVGDLQLMDDQSLQDDLEANLNVIVQSDEESLSAEDIQREAAQTPLLDRDKIAEDPAEGSKGIILPLKLIKALATVTFRVVKRHINKTDHGFFPSVVEEILREFYLADFGAWVWGGMKQQAEDMWAPNDELTGIERHAGSYLLEKLSQLKAERPDLTIDIIGHSAGSIVACNLLRVTATRHPELTYRNLIFLAPACTVDLFVDEVIGRQNRFKNFRMFTMYDEAEKANHLQKGVYVRSLLYFISGVLEHTDDKPIAGMHRYIQGKAPYDTGNPKKASDYLLAAGQDRLVLSKSNLDAQAGLQCDSIEHGAFDDNKLTQGSLVHMLQ
ncbi:hypothetical protein GCM10027299_23800 [Larkinella ripae]